jgi:hypothetical protein
MTQELKLRASQPRNLSAERAERWSQIVRIFDEDFGRQVALVFLGELLEVLDGGARCRFGGKWSGVRDMGAESYDWELSTGRRLLGRVYEREYDSYELKTVMITDETRVRGFSTGEALEWDGGFDGGVHLVIESVDAERKERIVALAQELFREVAVEWGS